MYIFISSLIRPEPRLPCPFTRSQTATRQILCAISYLWSSNLSRHKSFKLHFPAAAVSLCDGCETADRAACRMRESADRQQERGALSQPRWTHHLCLQSRELLKSCFTAASLRRLYQSFALCLGGCVYNSRWKKSCQSWGQLKLCSLQPAIQALKRFVHPAICMPLSCSCVCVCVCRLAEMESQNCSFFTDSLSPDESLWVRRHLHPPTLL